MPDSPSLHELDRRLERVENNYIGRERYDADDKTQAERDRTFNVRISTLEESGKWVTRLIISAFFGIIVNALVIALAIGNRL